MTFITNEVLLDADPLDDIRNTQKIDGAACTGYGIHLKRQHALPYGLQIWQERSPTAADCQS